MSNAALSTHQPTILLVDDEKNLRFMLGAALEYEGYQVQEAISGEHCLTICQQHLPDLILLDALMPILDGFTCCVELRKQFGDRCPPILMITALADSQSVDRAFAAGAIDFVTKPIHWSILRQRVQRILMTHQLAIELRQAKAEIQSLKEQLQTVAR